MNDKYANIINLPHHISKKHPRMDIEERAAQFAPFAALSGHGASVSEAARLTYPRFEADESEIEEINARLNELSGSVTLCYFVPDGLKEGGQYVTEKHTVKKIDPSAQEIVFTDGLRVKFSDIYSFED